MLKLAPNLVVGLVPNVVNLNFFKIKTTWDAKDKRILFVANFKWLQNIEAAELLLNEVFPLIKNEIPSAKVWIVGQHIPEEIKKRKSESVLVDDLKEDDQESIRNAYYLASAFVSPLRGPGGTRLKHFAAMAAKLPLITTSVGAEGLGAKDGENIIVRNNPMDIAKGVIDILNNPVKAKKIASNARKLVEEKYSWYKMSQSLDQIYEETRTINNNS